MGATADGEEIRAIENDAIPGSSTPRISMEENVAASDAERLGAYWLERHRRVDGPGQLPSEEPLNELLLGLDYFRDLREESPTALARAQSITASSEQAETLELNEDADEVQTSGNEATADGQPAGSSGTEHLRPIPTIIANEREYVGHFLPLFLQEAKQSIVRAAKLDMQPPEDFVQVGPAKLARRSNAGTVCSARVQTTSDI